MTPPVDPPTAPEHDDSRLDGYTLDQLSDYLDVGMTPPNPDIDSSAACQIALTSLRRVRAASALLLDAEADDESPPGDGWVERILNAISLDFHAGRSIPVAHPSPRAVITTTEGAIRGLIRAAGDTVHGLLVGRCTLDGDITTPGAPIRIRVDASVFWGQQIPKTATQLQEAISLAMSNQTELNVTAIDVTVHDIYRP